RELSFDRIDTRATRRRHRTLARQFAIAAVVVISAGAAVVLAHSGSKPNSLRVTNSSEFVTPATDGKPGSHHTPATTAPTGHTNTPGSSPTAPLQNDQTPGSSPSNVIAPPPTNAPSSHTTSPASTPATSPRHIVDTAPTTVFQPTIPANLPPPYNVLTVSR